jgi:hypothetical protein
MNLLLFSRAIKTTQVLNIVFKAPALNIMFKAPVLNIMFKALVLNIMFKAPVLNIMFKAPVLNIMFKAPELVQNNCRGARSMVMEVSASAIRAVHKHLTF